MACRTLLRRKTQMDLLAGACRQRAQAHVALRRKDASAGEVRFAALERDGIQLDWAGTRIPELEVPGQAVEVRFEYQGEHYVFAAVTRESLDLTQDGRKARSPIKLSLPLRLERARRRRKLRLELQGRPPIMATFTHAVDDRRQFQAQLRDIGDGGLGVVANADEVSELHTGDLFWADVTLPGEKTHPELVVRLTHLRPVSSSNQIVMGWAFQPTDDVANHEMYLRRLEAFIAQE